MSRILFYHVFQTQCVVDGSSYFGMTSNENANYGRDGGKLDYIGNGPRLIAKIREHGPKSMRVIVHFTDPLKVNAQRHLDGILKDTINHPLSLNVSEEERFENISDGMEGLVHEQAHNDSISIGMRGTKNALGNVRPKLKWIHNKTTNEELQIEVGEDLLEGFEFGRLKKGERAKGAKQIDYDSLSDAELARLPEFMTDAIAKRRAKRNL